ncbi:hypothetical protein [Burkholderia cenocepacia]|uniref:hypothetical protein n=1 Tax=Burkholderia cenocepacia TaxID=95486 RepID=UPI002238960A|nr:hypothetical protein [Burkholderia cenocepacia]MCW5141061.1 hypothetical protein [Burkholderia cenocepacia]
MKHFLPFPADVDFLDESGKVAQPWVYWLLGMSDRTGGEEGGGDFNDIYKRIADLAEQIGGVGDRVSQLALVVAALLMRVSMLEAELAATVPVPSRRIDVDEPPVPIQQPSAARVADLEMMVNT